MEVSIHRTRPGIGRSTRSDVRPLPFSGWLWAATFLICGSLVGASASAFTLRQDGGQVRERLRADDIVGPGGSLNRASEQVFSQGTFQASLNDLTVPLDVNLSGTLSGSLMASIERDRGFAIRLSNAERNQCLDDGDFSVSVRASAPVANAFASLEANGGLLRAIRFEPLYQGGPGGGQGSGRQCPRQITYGYSLDLNVDGAVAAGRYEALVEITVQRLGPGGATETLQLPFAIDMPGVLLLYHYSQINVDLAASAIASALGASSACSGGYCMSLGNRTVSLNQMGTPIDMGIENQAPAFQPVQTITLRDAVGVRATGCSAGQYDSATFQVLNPVGGILTGGGVIPQLQGQSCGLVMRTGDLSFDLDLAAADASTSRATATIQITVTGL